MRQNFRKLLLVCKAAVRVVGHILRAVDDTGTATRVRDLRQLSEAETRNGHCKRRQNVEVTRMKLARLNQGAREAKDGILVPVRT